MGNANTNPKLTSETIMFKLYTYGFQRKRDNFYISYYHWKNHMKDHLTEVKYAVEDSLKWDLPQHFKTRTQKSDYSYLRVKRSSRPCSLSRSLPLLHLSKLTHYQGRRLPRG